MLRTVGSRRRSAVLVLGLSGALLLSGCRSDPSVAAYVGDTTITTDQLDAAVQERLQDPDIAAFAATDETAFTRQVLGLMVQEDVYAAVSQRYDVQVSDGDVQSRIAELLAGSDPEAEYQSLATQGISRDDVTENVRQQIVDERVAVAAGQADLSETALRAQFEQVREGLGQIQLGFITTPDAASAQQALSEITLDPAVYPAVAARFPSQSNTLPAIQGFGPDDIPSAIVTQVSTTEPGSGFVLSLPGVGEVVVFVAGITYPTYEDSRDDLAAQAASDAQDAGAAIVAEVRDDLDITVNPAFGTLDGTQVVSDDGGVVDILGDDSAADDSAADDSAGTGDPATSTTPAG